MDGGIQIRRAKLIRAEDVILKEKMKGTLANVEIPLFRIVVNVLIDVDCATALEQSVLWRDYGRQHKWENTYGAYIHHENLHCIVLTGGCNIDTVSHECFHAVMNLLKIKGIDYCDESEECFAYTLGFLTQKVWDLKSDYDRKVQRNLKKKK